MSLPLTIETLISHHVISADKADIQELYVNALENLNLSAVDYLTIRDLLQFIDQPGKEIHALMLCMFASLAEGSVCICLDQFSLNRRLHQFLEQSTITDCLVQNIISNLYNNKLTPVIGKSIDDYKPLIQPTDDLLYFQKYYAAEHILGQILKSIIKTDTLASPITDDNLTKILIEICDTRPMRLNHKEIHLNDEQILALIAVLLKRLVIISGGPGTGKTSIVIAILRLLTRAGISLDRIKLAAPTGRAAQRLTESIHAVDFSQDDNNQSFDNLIRCEATTIHHLLGYKKSRNSFTYNQHNILPADVIIIDEVSMVDMVLMTKLLQAIPENCRIIFLGDRNQLPSIDAGDVLANLIPESSSSYSSQFQILAESIRPGIRPATISSPICSNHIDRVVFLTKNYRFEPTLLKITAAINALPKKEVSKDKVKSETTPIIDNLPLLDIRSLAENSQFPQKGCWHLLPDNTTAKSSWLDVIQSWGNYHYLTSIDTREKTYKDYIAALHEWKSESRDENRDTNNILAVLFRFINRARILTLIHAGLYGTSGINKILISQLQPELDNRGSNLMFGGLPVLITRNDKIKGLFNRDIGVILGNDKRGYRAAFPRSGSYITFPVNELPPYEPAFAMTVHKSQGSEYDRVLLVLLENPNHRLLTREIIYTGLTRTKNLAIIYGSKDALQTAITNHIHRESGLDIWEK